MVEDSVVIGGGRRGPLGLGRGDLANGGSAVHPADPCNPGHRRPPLVRLASDPEGAQPDCDLGADRRRGGMVCLLALAKDNRIRRAEAEADLHDRCGAAGGVGGVQGPRGLLRRQASDPARRDRAEAGGWRLLQRRPSHRLVRRRS